MSAKQSTNSVAWQHLRLDQWPTSSCLDSIAAVFTPHCLETQLQQDTPDLIPGAKVLVPVGKRVMGVQQGPLLLNLVRELRVGLIVGEHGGNAEHNGAQARAAYLLVKR